LSRYLPTIPFFPAMPTGQPLPVPDAGNYSGRFLEHMYVNGCPGMTREGDRMLRSQLLDMDQLHQALKAARRWGVRDSRLESHAPRLIELLYPAQQYPALSVHHRAMAAENLIKAAINDLGGEVGHLSAVLFGVDPATSHLLLQQRRGIAAQRVGVLPATWHR